MTQTADIFDPRTPMRGAFMLALGLHAAVVGVMVLNTWLNRNGDSFGAKDAGGAIGVEAVSSIPLPHHGMENPVANDTDSEVPQTPAKPIEREKIEKPPPDAIPLKSRKIKKPQAQVASERQVYRPFEELERSQLTSKSAPQVSNPLYSAAPGAGRVGTGMNTTLGSRFAGYAAQIQQLVAQKWKTADLNLNTAPLVVARFELMRDGSIRDLVLLQTSGISSLDTSVRRAIMDASPFPPIPPGFDKDFAMVEFTFELKR